MRSTPFTALSLAAAITAALTLASTWAAGADKAPPLEWKVKKGDKPEFTVKSGSSSTMSTGKVDLKLTKDSEVLYLVEVQEQQGKDLSLQVTYASVKATLEGADLRWSFDSTKVNEADETAATLKELIAKPILVKVKAGKVASIDGFPTAQFSKTDKAANRRLLQVRSIAGPEVLKRHLRLILATALQGQPLGPGKTIEPAEPGGKDEEGDAAAAGAGGEPGLAYRYEGEEKIGGADAAKFAVSVPESAVAKARGAKVKGEGIALVSRADGLISKLSAGGDLQAEKISAKWNVSINRK